MNRFRIFFLLSSLLVLVSCTGRRFVTASGYAQGGEFRITYNVAGSSLPESEIRCGIDSILNLVDSTLSGYNRGSVLSRLNRGDTVKVNEVFERIYELSYEYFELTGGAFDISCAELFDVWGFGFTNDTLPSDEKIASVLSRCGMSRLRRNVKEAEDASGRLCLGNLLADGEDGFLPRLNFNAVAQGFTCDLVAEYLHSVGISDMLVDIGEIYCEGSKREGEYWSIGIDNPVDGNNSPGADMRGIWSSEGRSCGIVTSGNYRKFYIRDGRKYAHIVDPRTGKQVDHNLLSATVVSSSSAGADAVATACMVLGPQKGREFIESMPELEAYLISADGVWKSEGFTLMK